MIKDQQGYCDNLQLQDLGCCAAARGDDPAGAKIPLNEGHVQGQPSHGPGSLEQHLIRTNHQSAQELTVGYLLCFQPCHDDVVISICCM